jgi:hypothetical protein
MKIDKRSKTIKFEGFEFDAFKEAVQHYMENLYEEDSDLECDEIMQELDSKLNEE